MTIPTFTLLDRLRKAREHAGLTQATFAEKVGVSTVTYSRYESGARNIPDDVVEQAAKVTGVPLDWFYIQDNNVLGEDGAGQPVPVPPRITLEWDGDTYRIANGA